MSKKKWSLLLAIFFLAQSITSSSILSFESSPLNLPTDIDVNYSSLVLYESSLANPAVTFQILPSLNEILSDCKIKPCRIYSSSEVARSS